MKPRSFLPPLFIFLTALAARVVFYFVVKTRHPEMWSAQEIHINGWLEIAQNLVSGRGYSQKLLLTYFPTDHLPATAARGPVPVLFLALMLLIFNGYQLYPFFFCSWALSACNAVLLYFLAQKVFECKKMALATALCYSFYLPEMFISTAYAAASESLFTLLLLGYFLMAIRSVETKCLTGAFAAGGLLGLAWLCRPVVLFFPLLYMGWRLKEDRSKAVLAIGTFLAALSLCLAPWAIRNQMVFHKPVLSTTLGGYNLFRHNVMIRQNQFEIIDSETFDPIAREAVAKAGYDFNQLNEVQLDGIFKREALRVILDYPGRYFKLCALRAGWLWYKINGEKGFYLAQNLLVYLFMFPGLILAVTRRHFLLKVLGFHFLGYALFHILINTQFRFICPMMPCGILFAVHAFGVILKAGNRKVPGYNLKP